ncbi:hypothetical protein UVI_02056240 [Ustilaginoidea virens]|uniref:Argonaute complex, subunit Arb1 n=1 Tax=Ustilaginoidea virens TaxID=1159556 RepID=A0A1B5L4B3_USTVR|nr:hypothetical protein UVI_02056240 [Ustilaginoidea virens]
MGGVDTSQNSFSGHDPKDLKDLTPAERRQATAIDSVHFGSGTDERFYNGDDAHWSVDFAGVAAGFFSTSFGLLTGFHPQKAEAAINLVENFLRYVLQHGICTEYKDNVESALQVCQQARIEWPMLNQLSSDLPGCFNLAAMELLDKADASDWSFLSFSPPDGFDAKAVFRTACELRGEAATLDLLAKGGGVKARRQHDLTAKVVRIDRPSGTMLQQFAAVEVEGYSNKIDPVGKVFLKRTVIEDEWVRPQQPDPAATPSAEESEFCCWLYLEDCLLENILPGMKMELTVVELITGLWILKTVSRIVPTFYTFLPQQMMRHFKHPRQHDKLAPSANDAAAEEGQAAAEVA